MAPGITGEVGSRLPEARLRRVTATLRMIPPSPQPRSAPSPYAGGRPVRGTSESSRPLMRPRRRLCSAGPGQSHRPCSGIWTPALPVRLRCLPQVNGLPKSMEGGELRLKPYSDDPRTHVLPTHLVAPMPGIQDSKSLQMPAPLPLQILMCWTQHPQIQMSGVSPISQENPSPPIPARLHEASASGLVPASWCHGLSGPGRCTCVLPKSQASPAPWHPPGTQCGPGVCSELRKPLPHPDSWHPQ